MAATVTEELSRTVEHRVAWMHSRPMLIDEFLDRFGEDDDFELIDGVLVERIPPLLDHEKLFVWLLGIIGSYVEDRDLGVVLGSRTAVEITPFRVRIPDLLFVRRERMDILQQRAILGAPDLVVELVSPNDRPSDIFARETDYRTLGVGEIWLIDVGHRRVRALFREGNDYRETVLESGSLASQAVDSFQIEVEWLWAQERPAVRAVLEALLRG